MKINHRPPLSTGCVIAATLLAATSIQAAVLVSENYDSKTSGISLIGQDSALGSTGLTGNYSFNGAGLGTSQTYTVVAGGLAFSTYSTTSGNSLQATSSNTGATAVAGISLGASYTGTLYSSYLINFSALSTSGGFSSTRITSSSTAVGTASRFGLGADTGVNSAINPGIAYDNATTASGTNLVIDTTYMMIGRFTNVGTALSGSTEGVATMFALTAAQWDSFVAAGGTDVYLDEASVGTGDGNISARVADTAVTTGTYSFANTGNYIQTVMSASTTGSTQTYKLDNMLYGTSLADVAVAPIPEPASAALIGALGALTFVVLRRRR